MKIKLLVVAYEHFVFCKTRKVYLVVYHYCRSSEKDEDGEERNKKVSDDDDENGYEDVTEVKEEDVEKDRNADDE